MTTDTVAAALADGDPRVWRGLLVAHAARPDGRCGACTVGGSMARPRWPRRLYEIAEHAGALAASRFEPIGGPSIRPST